MTPTVHILAYVRKPEMLPAAGLVFQSLRVGFPTAEIKVWGNNLQGAAGVIMAGWANSVGAEFRNLATTVTHDAWVQELLHEALKPFWICDTDMVFWSAVENWSADLLLGRFEPEFDEEWTRTRHMERLHTCLMYFNAGPLRAAMRAWMAQIPSPFGLTAEYPFVRQTFVPLLGQHPLFYDTCAGLYHAVGGTAFTQEQDEAFDHLHCGTFADVIGLKGLREAHEAIYANPGLARGMKATQDAYYASRAMRPLGSKIRDAGDCVLTK